MSEVTAVREAPGTDMTLSAGDSMSGRGQLSATRDNITVHGVVGLVLQLSMPGVFGI
jgi:hypothetical protein